LTDLRDDIGQEVHFSAVLLYYMWLSSIICRLIGSTIRGECYRMWLDYVVVCGVWTRWCVPTFLCCGKI